MISIILPVYNVENYLEKCLDSILIQTFQRFELIIVDDGSTDNSKEIIKRYQQKCHKIIFIEQKNQGLSVARNNALKRVNGEFVLFLDSDDYISDKMLEKLYEKAINTNSDVTMCGYYEFLDKNPDIFNKIPLKIGTDTEKKFNSYEVSDLILNLKISGMTWNKLFKMDSINKHGLFFEPGRYTQDWYPIFEFVSKCKVISFVDDCLYYYRINDSATTSKRTPKRLEDYTHAVSNIYSFVLKNNEKFSGIKLTKFKLVTFSISIGLYKDIYSGSLKRFYKNFEKQKYMRFTPKFNEIIFSKNISKRVKINLILWKIKVFHLINI